MNRSGLDALIMEQEGLTRLDRENIERIQLEKLNTLLLSEKKRGGFYKDLPPRLDSLAELSTLPFTTDGDLAQRGGSMLLVSQSEVRRVLSDVTSGTSGTAKRVFYTAADCENTVRLFAAGLGELVYPGSRTMICMPFSGPFGLGELIAEAIRRLGAEPLKLGAALSYGELKQALDSFRPDTFVGMPTALLALLRTCGRGSLKRALVSGDSCANAVSGAVEAVLGTRLFPHYGSREMGLAGAVCCPAHCGMHLRENVVIAEIVGEDGLPLPEGQRGELVITTVGMEAQPLIRYRTGDYARFIPGPCPCGSEVRRIDAVARRSGEDMLALDEALFALPDMVDYRAERREGNLCISALTAHEPDIPAIAAAAGTHCVSARRAALADTALYRGKRRIIDAAPVKSRTYGSSMASPLGKLSRSD